MILINKGENKKIYFTINPTIVPVYYLFEFVSNDTGNKTYMMADDISTNSLVYKTFLFQEGSTQSMAGGFIANPGTYDYNLYQTGTQSLNPLLATSILEIGLMTVVGNDMCYTPDINEDYVYYDECSGPSVYGITGATGASGLSGTSGSSGSSGVNGTSGLSSISNNTITKRNIVLATATASSSQNYTTNLFGVPNTNAFQTNYTIVAPFMFDRSFTFSSITLDFAGNAGITTATFSFALYADNGIEYPGDLLFSSVGFPTTVGLKQHIISGTISQNTKYWIAYRTVHTTQINNAIRTGTVANLNPISIGNIGVTSFATAYYVYRSSIGDGFPSTWTNQLYAFSGQATPVIGFL